MDLISMQSFHLHTSVASVTTFCWKLKGLKGPALVMTAAWDFVPISPWFDAETCSGVHPPHQSRLEAAGRPPAETMNQWYFLPSGNLTYIKSPSVVGKSPKKGLNYQVVNHHPPRQLAHLSFSMWQLGHQQPAVELSQPALFDAI